MPYGTIHGIQLHSGQGEALLDSYKLQIKYEDGMDPGVVEYWDDIGVLKEEHDAGLRSKWYSYLPHSALDESSTKQYPLIINLPHDPFLTEARGFARLASADEVIVVIPTAADIEDIYSLDTHSYRPTEKRQNIRNNDHNYSYYMRFNMLELTKIYNLLGKGNLLWDKLQLRRFLPNIPAERQ